MNDELEIEVAKAIGGPYKEVPKTSKYSLTQLRDHKYERLSTQQKNELRMMARAAIQAISVHTIPKAFALRAFAQAKEVNAYYAIVSSMQMKSLFALSAVMFFFGAFIGIAMESSLRVPIVLIPLLVCFFIQLVWLGRWRKAIEELETKLKDIDKEYNNEFGS